MSYDRARAPTIISAGKNCQRSAGKKWRAVTAAVSPFTVLRKGRLSRPLRTPIKAGRYVPPIKAGPYVLQLKAAPAYAY